MKKKIKYDNGQGLGECIYLHDVAPKRGDRIAAFRCLKCDYNKKFEARIADVKNGSIRSCGCLQKIRASEAKYKHGLSDNKVYISWTKIKGRCLNPNDKSYKYYGGRGIGIYDGWKDNPVAFVKYVSSLANCLRSGYSIDRINNDGNYEPENLRWVDQHTQRVNQRNLRMSSGGYTGVYKKDGRFYSKITINKEIEYLGGHSDPKSAAETRDWYIIKNGLWEYPLQIIKSA